MVPERCLVVVVGSWSKRVAGAEAAEVDEATLPAAGAEGKFGLDHGGRGRVLRVRRRLRAPLARQQQARLLDERASGRVPEAEIADLVQALGQHVAEEPAHELAALDAARAQPVGLALLVPDDDPLIVEGDDAVVGDATRNR
jgi:hypothetical protein